MRPAVLVTALLAGCAAGPPTLEDLPEPVERFAIEPGPDAARFTYSLVFAQREQGMPPPRPGMAYPEERAREREQARPARREPPEALWRSAAIGMELEERAVERLRRHLAQTGACRQGHVIRDLRWVDGGVRIEGMCKRSHD